MRVIIAFLLLSLNGLGQRKEIRTPQGRLVGTITCDRQRCDARDASGRLRGYYLIRPNETRDPQGRLISRGDTLTSLLQ